MKNSIQQLKRSRFFAWLLLCALLLGSLAFCSGISAEPEGEDTGIFFSESFESDFAMRPSGWYGNAGKKDTEYASHGTSSIRLVDDSTSRSAYIASPKLRLERGIYYRISLDVYNLTGNGSVFIQFFKNSAPNSPTDSVSSTVTGTGKWNTVNFTVSLPDSADYAEIWLYSGMANRGETCYDHIQVRPEAGDDGQQVYDFELKTNAYPRLYFTAEELGSVRAFAAQTDVSAAGYSGNDCKAAIIKEADELLTQSSFTMTYYSSTTVTFTIPFTEKHFTSSPAGYGGTNYPYWQEMGNRMMEMMQTLALAYSLTDNEAYAERAITLAVSLANWSTWTEYPTTNRTSLETGYFVTGVSTVYDLCHSKLTDDQKNKLETAIVELGLKPLYADLSAFTDHNYYVNKASALAMGSLLLLGKHEDAAKYLSRAYDFFAWYLNCRMESDSQEGLSYTSYAFDMLYSALDQLRRVTGNDRLLSHPYANVVFRWAIMSGDSANGYGPPISDTYSNTYFFTVANVMDGTDCAGLAKWYLSTRKFDGVTDFRKMVYHPDKNTAAAESPEQYFARTGINLTNGVVDGIGWGALRTGWDQNGMLLVCVGNNSSQGHSHYDQNSFVLSKGGEWIFSDPGYQDYGSSAGSDYTLAYGHSTVYVDGKSQSVKGGGSLTALLDSASYSALLGSAAGAYRSPSLSKFDRNYIMVNYGGGSYYVLVDDIAADSDHTYSWVLNAEGMQAARRWNNGGYDIFTTTGGGFTGSEFFAVGKNGALRIAFDREHAVKYDTWNKQGKLISVSSGDAAKSTSFCAVISALEGRGVNSSAVEKSVSVAGSYSNDLQIGVRTLHGGVNDIIVVSKGTGVSADGLIGNGQSASLFGLNSEGSYSGYAAVQTTELTWNGKVLLRSSAPVSANLFFEGSESVILGDVGTTVQVYAPGGIGSVQPDADGYCSVTLEAERTVLNVNAASLGGDTEPVTDPVEEPQPKKGCRSAVAMLPVVLVSLAACAVCGKKKKH